MKLKTEEIILLAFTAYLVLTPVLQYEPYGIDHLYNVKRYLQVALLLLVGGTLLFSSNQRKQTAEFISLFPKWIYWVLGGIIVIGGISSLLALEQDWAFLEFGHWLLMGVATFCVGAIAYKYPQKATIYISAAVLAYAFFYLCRVSFFNVLYLFGEAPLWPGDLNRKALYSFSHVRFFNQTQTWTIPILVCLGWYTWCFGKIQALRWGSIVIISLWGALVFASGGRGTMLGVVLAGLIILLFLIKNRKGFITYCSSAVILSILIYGLFFELLAGGTSESAQRISSSGRLDNWMELVPEILSQPVIGYGPMHYSALNLDNAWGHPHNWFIQFAYEWGLIVACILLVVFVLGLYKFGNQLKDILKNKEYDNRMYWIKIGLFWSLLAGFVHALFSGVAVMPLSQMWLVFITGILMGLYKYHSVTLKTSQRGQTNKKIEIFVLISVICGLAGLFYWGINNPINRTEVDQQFYEESTSSRSYPRYWQRGKFGDF